MRILTNEPTVTIDGLELPIQNMGKDGKIYNCYVEPLQRFKREIDAMLSHHCKIFILRFDVRIYTNSQTNEVISNFRKSYAERVKRYYKTKNVAYVWCREVEKKKKQHYHFAVIVDGNEAWVAGALLAMAEEVAAIQDLSIGYCDNPSYLIKRTDLAKGDYSTYNDAFYRLSYLAKERGKTIKAERANSYQTSRIKPRLNENGKVFMAGDDYKKWIAAKAKANKVKRVKSAPNPLIAAMTDAERQLPLF
jgi:hypothetical protein